MESRLRCWALFIATLLFVVRPACAMGGFFDQLLDHFEARDSDNFKKGDSTTFNQLYFSNTDFYKDNGAPEILVLGGMQDIRYAPINDANSPLCVYAAETGSRMWILEHRFYGASEPFRQFSLEHLQLLRVDQAVADAVEFIRYVTHAYRIKKGNWLVFGGGYSGLLALKLRAEYPELTLGVVASSSPIQPQLDFYGYIEHCDHAYRNHNSKCHQNILNGFLALKQFMDSAAGREQMQKVFGVEPAFDKVELTDQLLQHFYWQLMQSFLVAVENNKLNRPPFDKGAGIEDICTLMLKPAFNPVARLVNVREYMQKQLGLSSDRLDIDYLASIDALKNSSASGERARAWQECSELARFPTTHYNMNVFGSNVQLNYFVNRCVDVFGEQFNVTRIAKSVQAQEREQLHLTNTIIVNGLVDPWSRLSSTIESDQKTGVTVLNLKSTAHCADLQPISPQDSDELTKARHQIFQTVQGWTIDQAHAPAKSSEKIAEKPKIVRNSIRENDKILDWDAKIYPNPSGGNNGDLTQDGWYFIEQDLDHFEPTGRKFNQSFAISFAHYKAGGPVFFALSGETPGMTYEEFTDHTQPGYLAANFNALLVLLEHRYYGASQATDDLSQSNLKWLTIEQALADAAVFIKTINKKLSLETPRWVTFGCSYGGALSAWMRLKFPELTVGAFASSPLMMPEVDVYEYNQIVNRVYREVDCHTEISAAFAQVQQLFLDTKGRAQLNSNFRLCRNFSDESIAERDRQSFFRLLIDPFFDYVERSFHLNTIVSVCARMKEKSQSLLERLNNALGFYTCLDWSYENQIRKYRAVNYDYSERGQRQWLWQRCTQLGLFPSTDSGYNAFGSAIPIEYYLGMCSDVFGSEAFGRPKIEDQVLGTRLRYGKSFRTTNLLVISSANDPWKELAVEDNGITFLENKGNSHCSDTKPPLVDDQNRKLYKKLKAQLKIWLE